ncbi:putative protein N(5)-glutamine methyltransferase [Myceligenerans indicum]|uniref:putative protein N(5)-glutamine methyltransferase n=1 Tax=Myceligenerans indicum TaxID=2593663 RepID=UPI003FD819D0
MNEDPALVARLRAAGCVFAEDEARLLAEAAGADDELLERMVSERVGGAPLEQVVGWAELHGRRWSVTPGVFVPRRRSELLITEALAHLRGRQAAAVPESGRSPDAVPGAGTPDSPGSGAGRVVPRPGARPEGVVVVDLCCGCGALGGSVALDLVGDGIDVALHASDADPAATACARDNLAAAAEPGLSTARPAADGPGPPAGRLAAVVHDGDLDAPLPGSLRGHVDVLLCNAPYVPTDAIALMPREAREHEPLLALDGGADGLGVLRRAIAAAPGWLRPGGAMLFETGHDQAGAAAALTRSAGLLPAIVSDDDLGATAIVARLPPG